MKLSEKIYNKQDFKPVKGLLGSSSGFDADDVNEFLDIIAEDAEKLEKEIVNLRKQIDNLTEEQKIEEQVNNIEDDGELKDLKEKLKRKLTQLETLERANKQMFYTAEEIKYKIEKEAEENADKIVEEAKQEANSLLKKVEERCAEKEREIQRLESKEKELREQFAGFAKLIQTAVNEG